MRPATQILLQVLTILLISISVLWYYVLYSKMAEQPIKCGVCPKLVTPQKTWSDRNGNQGKLYVMVSIFWVPRFSLLISFFKCKGTTEQPHPQWFRFVGESMPQPTISLQGFPNTYDPWIIPTEIQQPVTFASASSFDETACAVTGCDKRINQKCVRHACAGHCRIQGGCSLIAHAHKNSEPSQASQALRVPAQAVFPSQSAESSASTWGHVFAPTAEKDSSTPIGKSHGDYAPLANSMNLNVPTGYVPPLPIQPTCAITSRPHLEPPPSMNPLPNPRYSSQIWPVFTEELAQKQELLRTRQIQDAERLDAANRAKHEVTVCAWFSVSPL
jgi:hypothetical protein